MDATEIVNKLNKNGGVESCFGVRKLFPESVSLTGGPQRSDSDKQYCVVEFIDGKIFEYRSEVDDGGYPLASEEGWKHISLLELCENYSGHQILESLVQLMELDLKATQDLVKEAYKVYFEANIKSKP